MKEILREWNRYLSEANYLGATQEVLDYTNMFIECVKIFESHGIDSSSAKLFARKLVAGIKKAVEDKIKKGGAPDDSLTVLTTLKDALSRLMQWCLKNGIDPKSYLSKFTELTAEGTLAGDALALYAVLSGTYSVYEWLANVGKEFKKSSGPLATAELRKLEDRIKQEGFEKVKASEANTSIKKGVIAKYFQDAKKFNPNVVEMFPTVFSLLDPGWQKGLK